MFVGFCINVAVGGFFHASGLKGVNFHNFPHIITIAIFITVFVPSIGPIMFTIFILSVLAVFRNTIFIFSSSSPEEVPLSEAVKLQGSMHPEQRMWSDRSCMYL